MPDTTTTAILSRVASGLSIVSIGWLLLALRPSRSREGSLLMSLMVGVLVANLVYGLADFILINFLDDPIWCQFDGFMSSSGALFAALMTMFLAYESARAARLALTLEQEVETRRRRRYYFGFSLVTIASIFGVVVTATPGYGSPNPHPTYCHLMDPNLVAEIFSFWGWIWAAILSCLVSNFRVGCTLLSLYRENEETRRRLLPVVVQLFIYPGIFAFAALPSTVFRIISFASPDYSTPAMQALSGGAQVTFRLMGFFNALALGSSNYQAVRRLRKQCRCCAHMEHPLDRRASIQHSFIEST